MAQPDIFTEDDRGPIQRYAPWVLSALFLIALGWFVYTQVTGVEGIRVDPDRPAVISELLPPPPPPPPPPPEPIEKPPEPVDAEVPTPTPETPQPKQEAAPAPVTVNAPAQAGTDSYGLAAGSGGGMGAPSSTGTCLGPNCGRGAVKAAGTGVSDGFYRRYLATVLQQRVQSNDRVNRLVFSADFSISIDGRGEVTQVGLLKSSGKDDRDRQLAALLEAIRGLDPPPPGVRFPQRITVRGRRSL